MRFMSVLHHEPRGAVRVSLARFRAFAFDMDGVVTDTAGLHMRAWKRLFDDYLRQVAVRGGPPFQPFESSDYRSFVDGRARVDGVVAVLASRGLALPTGTAADAPSDDTAWGLANGKNELFLTAVARTGVHVFPSAVTLLRQLHALDRRTAVVTASRNARPILAAGRVNHLFDACVDGLEADRLGLAGKPDPAMFLEAARRLGVDPSATVVVEDAVAGVEAGRNGAFGLVIGVDRSGQRDALTEYGADAVVTDLDGIILERE